MLIARGRNYLFKAVSIGPKIRLFLQWKVIEEKGYPFGQNGSLIW